MSRLMTRRGAPSAEHLEAREKLRKTEIGFKCELCAATVYVVRANVWFGAVATQTKLRDQAMRDHTKKTGCAGNRLAPDALDAISAELFGAPARGASADALGAANAPTGIRPTEQADALFAEGIRGPNG